MPGECRLLDLLNALTIEELEALHRRADWHDIGPYQNDKRDFARRLRDSAERAIDRDDMTCETLMRQIRDDVIRRGPYTTGTKIRKAIDRLTISRVANRDDVNDEQWVCAQLYGALHESLGDEYEVVQERPLSQFAIDLYIGHQENDESYLIEAKRNERVRQGHGLVGQVKTYNDLLSNREHTFVLLLIDDEDLYWTMRDADNPQKQLDEYTEGQKDVIERIEDLPKTTVLTKVLPPNT